MKLRKLLGNLLLILLSMGFTWLMMELVLFGPLLRILPKPAFHHMVRELRVLGQTSFVGDMPKPGFLIITGDSNAQGKGDWFIDQGYDRRTRFHSAHVLQDLLGRDVMSMGRSGAGSFDGLVIEPLQTRAMLSRLGRDLPEPAMVLAYFYAGNDIENNLDFLQRWVEPRFGKDVADDPQALRSALRELKDELVTGHPRQWNDAPLFGNFILRAMRDTLRNTFTRKYIDVEPIVPPGTVNKALVRGEVTHLPDRLQSAPVELDDEQIRKGVAILRESLGLLAEGFAPAPVTVVYIPSPLGSYWLVGNQVSTFYGGERQYPTQRQLDCDKALFKAVREACASLDFPCVDTRQTLRQASQDQFVHGPRDWDHFNKAGYHALAKAVATALPQLIE